MSYASSYLSGDVIVIVDPELRMKEKFVAPTVTEVTVALEPETLRFIDPTVMIVSVVNVTSLYAADARIGDARNPSARAPVSIFFMTVSGN